jgi:hypothetical protein
MEKRSNEAVVRLHPNAQHTWPQLYECLSSVLCPFCISSHPHLGQENRSMRKRLKDVNIGPETVKLLQVRTGNTLEAIGTGKEFLSRILATQHLRERMDK